MRTKEVNSCIVCGSARFERLALVKKNGIDYSYMRCLECDLRFVNPIPLTTESEKETMNREVMMVPTINNLRIPISVYLDSEATWNKSVDNARVRDLMNYVKGGRLLDVGCNRGSFLVAAKEMGFNAVGVEVVPEFTRYIQNKYRIEIFSELKTANFPSKYFDVVNMSHILEHLENPVATLFEVNRILKPGGILGISLPNPCSFASRSHNIFHFLSLRYKRSRYSMDLNPPIHLYSFPKETLLLLLAKTQFKILRAFYVGRGNRTYQPFLRSHNVAWVLEQIIDGIGNILGYGSAVRLFCMKRGEI